MASPNSYRLQSQLIGFERKRKAADPALEPVTGKRGSCRLCGKYSQLTSSHVFPQAIGNEGPWLAQSYTTVMARENNRFTKRRFPNGIQFFTTCKACNSALGSIEDKTLIEAYKKASALMNYPLRLPPTVGLRIQVNRLFRSIIFHLVTANDRSPVGLLDQTAQKIKSGELHVAQSELFLFVWPYIGEKHVIVRDFAWTNIQERTHGYAHIIKLAPLGFAISDTPTFKGMKSLNVYLTRDNDAYVDIPLDLFRQENHDYWPAAPSSWEMILRGDSMGMISQRQ